ESQKCRGDPCGRPVPDGGLDGLRFALLAPIHSRRWRSRGASPPDSEGGHAVHKTRATTRVSGTNTRGCTVGAGRSCFAHRPTAHHSAPRLYAPSGRIRRPYSDMPWQYLVEVAVALVRRFHLLDNEQHRAAARNDGGSQCIAEGRLTSAR